MQTVVSEFEDRADEIYKFLSFVKDLHRIAENNSSENGNWFFLRSGNTNETQSEDLLFQMRSTLYLMLYNLVESSLKNCVCAVLDAIKKHDFTFNDLSKELKIMIWNCAKKNISDEKLTKNLSLKIEQLIPYLCLQHNHLFSGNVDAQVIRKTAKSLGVSLSSIDNRLFNPKSLHTVKVNRNNLAHGHESFQHLGKNSSMKEVETCCDDVINYMRVVLELFKNFISQRDYLNETSKNQLISSNWMIF